MFSDNNTAKARAECTRTVLQHQNNGAEKDFGVLNSYPEFCPIGFFGDYEVQARPNPPHGSDRLKHLVV